MKWDVETDIVVVGAGGCGLTAALAAAEKGVEIVVLEKTGFVLGNTSLSAGMIPAAGTRFQREVSIFETPEEMAEDILRKNDRQSDPELVLAVCRESPKLVEWMVDSLGIELSLVREFKYPGHRNYRMHAPKSRSGLELIKKLRSAVRQRDNIYLMLKSPVTRLITDDEDAVIGVEAHTPGGLQRIRAQKVILAANGFGGNPEMVEKYIPEMAGVLYFGYEANTGDAIRWGMELGAELVHMSAYQGHASVAASSQILVTWGALMLGGIMVNQRGERFGDETQGYSEFALQVIKQPEKHAYVLFDQEIYEILLSTEDFRQLARSGGLKRARTVEELAEKLHLDPIRLQRTIETYHRAVETGKDVFGRTLLPKKLQGILYGVKVVPALFHTQGGLKINPFGQVIHKSGTPITNLYAGGGSAAGISGNHPKGYLSGNGLLTALGFGKIAGEHASTSILRERKG